ncbi:MAG: hypothetical protein FWE61_05790 [Micrococcales bacterium]|nr:hypothetical protein [Micrococcales bacterium]
MTRTTLALLVVVALLTLAGCSEPATATKTPTATSTDTAAPADQGPAVDLADCLVGAWVIEFDNPLGMISGLPEAYGAEYDAWFDADGTWTSEQWLFAPGLDADAQAAAQSSGRAALGSMATWSGSPQQWQALLRHGHGTWAVGDGTLTFGLDLVSDSALQGSWMTGYPDGPAWGLNDPSGLSQVAREARVLTPSCDATTVELFGSTYTRR